MFTGLVQEVGEVISTKREDATVRLTIRTTPEFASETEKGDSIAVDGCCLTLAGRGESELEFDVSTATRTNTTLAELTAGDRVNLETSLRLGDKVGGHLVDGHVDGIAEVREPVPRAGSQAELILEVPESLSDYVWPRASVAVDGVSLTVQTTDENRIAIALIPETLERTTLGDLQVGDTVNLEIDRVARGVVETVSKLLSDSPVIEDGGGQS